MTEEKEQTAISTAVVAPRAAARLRAGHAWVYRSDVLEMPEQAASLAHVTDRRGTMLGTALASPHSEIALRLVTAEPLESEEEWFALTEERLLQAIHSRMDMLDEENDACRLVSSDADQLPGLVIDKYGELIVVEILSKALDRDDLRRRIVSTLLPMIDPSLIVERADPRIHLKEQISEPGGEPLFTKSATSPETRMKVIFHLNGLAFHYDARAGQKTGAFLDQRLNYRAAATHAHGEALDVFTYQGGFALHLAASCSHVTGVDASRPALEVAEENLAVNRGRIHAGIDWVEANAFDLLRDWSAADRKYDTIVLDPPAFARTKRAVPGALRGYRELNLRALKMLRPGGILVTCSCSHHVSGDDFQAIAAAAAGDAGRRVSLIERRGAASDHPVILNIPETEYLKCLILKVD